MCSIGGWGGSGLAYILIYLAGRINMPEESDTLFF